MLNINGTGEKFQLVTSAAGSIDVLGAYVAWVTSTETGADPAGFSAAITTAATTDLLVGVAAGPLNLQFLSVRNAHASVSNTVTFQRLDASRTVTVVKVTLLPGELLVINDAGVPFVYDAAGGVKASSSAGVVDPMVNGFRLSGVSATPIMTADSTTLSTVYLTQYWNNRIALHDGIQWQIVSPPSEVSLAVTGRTTDLPFDVFGFLSAGTVALEFLNWTSATARATGLTRVDGVWTKTGDQTRRYLGSIRARSATTYHWVMNGVDLPVKFDLFNNENRFPCDYSLRASTATWAYSLATIRQAQASANYQVDVMVGLQEGSFSGFLSTTSTNNTASIGRSIGIGYDSTTAYATGCITSVTPNTVVSILSAQQSRLSHMPTIGRHFYSWLEEAVATTVTTWTGSQTTAGYHIQSGMVGEWVC